MSTIDASRDTPGTGIRIQGGQRPHSRVSRRMWSYALIRPAGSVARRTGILLCLVVGALLLAASGAIHLQLWLMGYRNIPTIGPLFLLQGISGFLLAAILLLSRRLLMVVTAAGFMIATMEDWVGGGSLVQLGTFIRVPTCSHNRRPSSFNRLLR